MKLELSLCRVLLRSVPSGMFLLAGRSVCVCLLCWTMCLLPLRSKPLTSIFNVSVDLWLPWWIASGVTPFIQRANQSWVFTRVHEGSHPALFVVMASLINVFRVTENDLCDWKEGRRRLSGLHVLRGTMTCVVITKHTCSWRIWEMWTGVHALIFGLWCSM